MAWSDAARAAAAEARRMHMKMRTDRKVRQSEAGYYTHDAQRQLASPAARKELAARIKSIRRYGESSTLGTQYLSPRTLGVRAHLSTRVRNFLKKK